MDIMEMLRGRRTYRRYDESRSLPEEVVRDMMEAARLSASACNLQPLRYIIVENPKIRKKVFEQVNFAAALPKELGTPKEGERPVLYLVLYYNLDKKNRWIDTDAGIALANITMAAWSHGVGGCIMDNINRSELKEILGLTEEHEIQSLLALGYPSHRSEVVKAHADGKMNYYLTEDRDYRVPKREIKDIVSKDRWGEG